LKIIKAIIINITSPPFRLAGKKFGHPAGMKKINLKTANRNAPKNVKI